MAALDTPDVTAIFKWVVGGGGTALLAVIVAAPERLQIPLIAAIAGVGAAAVIADAVTRNGRAKMAAAITTANFASELRHADLEMPHSGADLLETAPVPTGPAPIEPSEPSQPKRKPRASQA